MEDMIRNIKDDVYDIRKGDDDHVDYNSECLYNVPGPRILHDDVLLPHFKELADAIQVSSDFGEVNIRNIELHPSALKILMPAMENNVTEIYMRLMTLPTMECYEIIAPTIRRNRTLERLRWRGNAIVSEKQADLLIETIIDNQSIKSVFLQRCFNQEGVNACRALVSLLTSGRSFRLLDFGTNPQIEILFMNGNELKDRGAGMIAQALVKNTNQLQLDIGRNSITNAGLERIRTALYDPSSLNAMESCNHTCWVAGIAGNDRYMTPQQRRHCKLYQLLSTRHAEGSNARHLNAELGEETDITKLVPRVLERVGLCSVDLC